MKQRTNQVTDDKAIQHIKSTNHNQTMLISIVGDETTTGTSCMSDPIQRRPRDASASCCCICSRPFMKLIIRFSKRIWSALEQSSSSKQGASGGAPAE
jgi:hypothetical protein